MTGRYVYCPMTAKRVGRRVTILDRIRRRFRARSVPDMFCVTGFEQPIYPAKK